MKKKVTCILFSIGLVLQYILSPAFTINAQQEGKELDYKKFVEEELSKKATQYLKGEMETIRQLLITCENDFDVDKDVAERLQLGTPFIIYNVEQNNQEDSFYYPLVDIKNNNIIAILSLVNTTTGWTYTINKDWAKELSDCNYLNKDYLFYQSEDNFIAESDSECVVLGGEDSGSDFKDIAYNDKKRIIAKSMKNRRKLDVKEERKNRKIKYGYSPAIRKESGGYYYCKLYNAKGQGPGKNPLCWAASAATAINYRKGTNYDAGDILVALNYANNDGRDIDVINEALTTYGLNYKYIRYTPKRGVIRKSIEKKYPVIIAGKNSYIGAGHAVTVYGYRDVGTNHYLMIWDSALNNGKGGMSMTLRNGTDIVFTTIATPYTTDAACYCRSISTK